MTEHQRVVDVIDRLAVVVDDDDLLAALIQLPALQRRDDVSIHDDQHGFGGQRMDRFTRRRKYLCVGIGLYIVDQLVRHARFGFDDDAAELFEGLFHDALHTDRCADAVEIGKAVSHDKDLIRVCDRAADGVGDHTHAHLAHLFCSSSRAAEEFVGVLTNDGNLVAASAERHFQRLARVELAFAHALAAAAQTDGDGRDPDPDNGGGDNDPSDVDGDGEIDPPYVPDPNYPNPYIDDPDSDDPNDVIPNPDAPLVPNPDYPDQPDAPNGDQGDPSNPVPTPEDPNNPGNPDPENPAELFPITFDAIVIDAVEENQETITEVTTPSITTYSATSDVTSNNEYKVGEEIIITAEDGVIPTAWDYILSAEEITEAKAASKYATATWISLGTSLKATLTPTEEGYYIIRLTTGSGTAYKVIKVIS